MKRALAVSLLLVVACAGNIQPTRQIDDAILAQSVRDALARDAALRAYDITVNAHSGRVTLLGVVGSSSDRDRAARVAQSVKGVTQVENLLSVR